MAGLICPLDSCTETFPTSSALKEHVILHLLCRWYRCPHCTSAFFYDYKAVAHVNVCTSRPAGQPPGVPRKCFDARYPLIRVWSLGMGLPTFKEDGSKDAVMLVREGQVWECAKNSHDVRFPSAADPTSAG